MYMRVLDIAGTHVNNPTCPQKWIAATSDGTYYCVDCGFPLLWKTVEVEEKPSASVWKCDTCGKNYSQVEADKLQWYDGLRCGEKALEEEPGVCCGGLVTRHDLECKE